MESCASALTKTFEVISTIECSKLQELHMTYVLKRYLDCVRTLSFKRSHVITNALSAVIQGGLFCVSRMIESAFAPPMRLSILQHLMGSIEVLFSKLPSEFAPRFAAIVSLILRRILRLLCSVVANESDTQTENYLDTKNACFGIVGNCNRLLIRFSSLPSVQKQYSALVSSVVEIFAEFPETKQIRTPILPGLFAIIDRIPPKDRKKIHVTLNQQSRLLLGEIFEVYLSDFKFFGKV